MGVLIYLCSIEEECLVCIKKIDDNVRVSVLQSLESTKNVTLHFPSLRAFKHMVERHKQRKTRK